MAQMEARRAAGRRACSTCAAPRSSSSVTSPARSISRIPACRVQLDTLPRDTPLLVHCNSGARAAAAVSLLERHGFQAIDVNDHFANYRRADRTSARAHEGAMTTPAIATARPRRHSPGDEPTGCRVAAGARTRARRAIAEVIDALRPLVALAQQAPALMAVADGLVRRGDADGHRQRHRRRARAAERRRGGPALRRDDGSGEGARRSTRCSSRASSRPARCAPIGELGRALVETAAAPPLAQSDAMGLLKALGQPDVQRALGFLVTFAERFGSRLREPQPAAVVTASGTRSVPWTSTTRF